MLIVHETRSLFGCFEVCPHHGDRRGMGMMMRGRPELAVGGDVGVVDVVGGFDVLVVVVVGCPPPRNGGSGIPVGKPDGNGNGKVGVEVVPDGCGAVVVPDGGGLAGPGDVYVGCCGGGVYAGGGGVTAPVACVCFAVGVSAVIVVGGGGTVAVTSPESSRCPSFCDRYTPPITTPVTRTAMTNMTAIPAPPLR